MTPSIQPPVIVWMRAENLFNVVAAKEAEEEYQGVVVPFDHLFLPQLYWAEEIQRETLVSKYFETHLFLHEDK